MTTNNTPLRQGLPKKPGLCLILVKGNYVFSEFNGTKFGVGVDEPWSALPWPKYTNGGVRKPGGWLPAVRVTAPTEKQLLADKPGDWRGGNPDTPGVYRVLSKLAEGTRDITHYRVWTGTGWSATGGTAILAVLRFLKNPFNSKLSAGVKWRELDLREKLVLSAVQFPVKFDQFASLVRTRAPAQDTVNGVALEYIRRNPGARAVEVGQHLGETMGYAKFYAQLLHHLHKDKHVYRELSMDSGGPTYRYYIANPSMLGKSSHLVDDVMIAPKANGCIAIRGMGAKFLLDPRALATLRALWAKQEASVGI